MELPIIILIVLIAFVIVVTFFNNKLDRAELTYQSKQYLLTKTELKFFKQLLQNLPEKFYVHAKTNLSDVIEPNGSTENNVIRRNKISQKHVDFVIIEKENAKIVMVIELDDSSHLSLDANKRDRVKNFALQSAKIPIVRIKPTNVYDFSFLLSIT